VGRGLPGRLGALAALILLLLMGTACSIEPQPVLLGSEECAHCRMMIGDLQFASQALTSTGKAYKFDAIECMAEWVNAGADQAELHSTWVTDGAMTERWVRTDDAHFLRSDQVRSPMGMGLTAYADRAAAVEHHEMVGGELMTWQQVLQTVAREGSNARHSHAH